MKRYPSSLKIKEMHNETAIKYTIFNCQIGTN